MHHAIPAAYTRDRINVLFCAAVVKKAMHSEDSWLSQKYWDIVSNRTIVDVMQQHGSYGKVLMLSNLVDSTLERHIVNCSQN